MTARPRITVVGGANTDIIGIPSGRFELGDSIPGHVRTGPGGVGRNIAENLARLGASVRLVTAFGDDADGAALAAACEAVGVDTSFSVIAKGTPGSRYLAVLDASADLAAAINDMRALATLTPAALDPGAFADADVVVLDTNLPPSSVARAVELAGPARVVLDPVSAPKSAAALPVLARLAALKPNLREAEELSGERGAHDAARRLVEMGVGQVFVTLGAGGVWCASGAEEFALTPLASHAANATGAGDAFTAGVAWGIATGMTMRESAEWALACSAITFESERTVTEQMSVAAVRARMEERQ